jgi:hypothetical protein
MMTNVDMKALARLGAKARLAELAAERDAILKLFPALTVAADKSTSQAAPEKTGKAKKRKRRRMSKEQRKAASDRMKAYWAGRKKA